MHMWPYGGEIQNSNYVLLHGMVCGDIVECFIGIDNLDRIGIFILL